MIILLTCHTQPRTKGVCEEACHGGGHCQRSPSNLILLGRHGCNARFWVSLCCESQWTTRQGRCNTVGVTQGVAIRENIFNLQPFQRGRQVAEELNRGIRRDWMSKFRTTCQSKMICRLIQWLGDQSGLEHPDNRVITSWEKKNQLLTEPEMVPCWYDPLATHSEIVACISTWWASNSSSSLLEVLVGKRVFKVRTWAQMFVLSRDQSWEASPKTFRNLRSVCWTNHQGRGVQVRPYLYQLCSLLPVLDLMSAAQSIHTGFNHSPFVSMHFESIL